MKLRSQVSTLLAMAGLFASATLLGGANCAPKDCPDVEFPTVRAVVECSPAAIAFAETSDERDAWTVEIRSPEEDEWTPCQVGYNTVDALLCAQPSPAEPFRAACARGSGNYELRARQGSLGSETLVINVSQGRCGADTEHVTLTLDVP